MNSERIRLIVEEATRSAVSRANRYAFARPVLASVTRQLANPTSARAVTLLGARQVGKSTILHQVLVRFRDDGVPAYYCDFTDPRLRGVGLRDVVDAIGVRPEVPSLLLYDEVHHVESWAQELKVLVDERVARFAVADSAAVVLETGARDAGVGRWTPVEVGPLGFDEWLQIRAASGQTLPTDAHERFERAEEHLRRGGFPAFALYPSLLEVHQALRSDVVVRALREDVTALSGLRDADGLDRLVAWLIESSGAIHQGTVAQRLTGASPQTTRHWVQALQDTHLVWPLPVWSRAPETKAKRAVKLYACDPGLVAAFTPRGDSTDAPEVVGRFLETACACALRTFARAHGAELGYHRDKTEADFVLGLGAEIHVIEATASRQPEKKARPLAELAMRLGASTVTIVASTTREREVPTGSDVSVRIAPLHAWLGQVFRGDKEALGWDRTR